MPSVDVIRPILALVHIGSALFYVTGYASAKTLTSLAVAESDPVKRRWILGLGDKFDFRFQIWGGTLVGLSGIPLALANGYSLTQVWVLASIVLYAVVVFIGAVVWRGRAATVRGAAGHWRRRCGWDPRTRRPGPRSAVVGTPPVPPRGP